MLKIETHTSFKKDYRRIKRRGYNMGLLDEVIRILAEEKPLPLKYRNHTLSGKYKQFQECHITPDWLLAYTIRQDELLLCLMRTGSRSDIF